MRWIFWYAWLNSSLEILSLAQAPPYFLCQSPQLAKLIMGDKSNQPFSFIASIQNMVMMNWKVGIMENIDSGTDSFHLPEISRTAQN